MRSRRYRWNQSCGSSAFIFFIFGIFFLAGVDGNTGIGIAVFMFFMALLDFRDMKTGWKLKNTKPRHASRFEAIYKSVESKIRKPNE